MMALSGCSMFQSDAPAPAQPAPKKKSAWWWPLGSHGPRDATAYLEYQRKHSESDKSLVALYVRNTHPTKAIEGDVRTTIETGPGESKVDNTHFSLGPSDSKKIFVYPATTQMSYEVSAFFKE